MLSQQPHCFERLGLINGDLHEIGLGISPEDEVVLTNDIEIVFHAAADVRFDESLKEAIETNVRGTREIMLLSQRMINLNVFIYVSTAFCTPGLNVRENCEPKFPLNLKYFSSCHKFFSLRDAFGSGFHDKSR